MMSSTNPIQHLGKKMRPKRKTYDDLLSNPSELFDGGNMSIQDAMSYSAP